MGPPTARATGSVPNRETTGSRIFLKNVWQVKDARFFLHVWQIKELAQERGRRAGDCSEVEAEKSWGATFAGHDSLKKYDSNICIYRNGRSIGG
jgi:hypothetical protein